MAKLNAALAAKGNEKTVKNHGGIQKKKNPKYKQTPTGKVALINGSKAQNNNNKKQQVQNKNNSPQKVQKNNAGKENSPAKKHNSPVGKNNSPAGKVNSPAQKKNNSPAGKNDKKKQQQSPQKQSPKKKLETSSKKLDLEEDQESDEDYNEGIVLPEEYSFAEEEDDEDLDDEEESDEDNIPNIFGTSLADHTEDDDDEFDAEEEIVKEKKGVKMFKGLPKEGNESLDTSNVENEEEEEGLGLKTLLGNSIVDDEDDEDFEIDEEVVEDEAEYQSDFSCSDEDEDEDDEDIDEEEEEDEDEDEDHSPLDSSKEKTDNEEGHKVLTEEERAEQNNRTVFVGNLPVTMTKENLQKLFTKFGPIESLRFRGAIPEKMNMPKKRAAITKKLNPNVKTVYAYIVYESEQGAKNALSMNGKKVEDHYLRVDSVNVQKPDGKKCVFVGNLPFRASVNTLWDHFKDCGKIESVRIIKDNATGLGKGIAYINFRNKDSVHLALNLNGSQVGNREIRVCTYAQDQVEKSQKNKSGKRSLPGRFKNDSPSKKIKTNPDDAVAHATHNSESAMRRKALKAKNAQQTPNNPKAKGTFQGQKATDGKKKKKPNKLNIKKKVMAAKLAAKPKKPVS